VPGAAVERSCWIVDPGVDPTPLLDLVEREGLSPQAILLTHAHPDETLADGDGLELGPTRWRVLHTPGHSPGSVTLFDAEHGIAISGDLLFAGSIGRVDFPTSDPEAMKRSLRRVLEELPDETRVLPGHGPETTIGAERRGNPFLRDDLADW